MNVKHPDLQLRDTAERRRYCFIHFKKMILLNDGVTLLLAIAESYVSTAQQFDLKRFVGEADLQFFAKNIESSGHKSWVKVPKHYQKAIIIVKDPTASRLKGLNIFNVTKNV